MLRLVLSVQSIHFDQITQTVFVQAICSTDWMGPVFRALHVYGKWMIVNRIQPVPELNMLSIEFYFFRWFNCFLSGTFCMTVWPKLPLHNHFNIWLQKWQVISKSERKYRERNRVIVHRNEAQMRCDFLFPIVFSDNGPPTAMAFVGILPHGLTSLVPLTKIICNWTCINL